MMGWQIATNVEVFQLEPSDTSDSSEQISTIVEVALTANRRDRGGFTKPNLDNSRGLIVGA